MSEVIANLRHFDALVAVLGDVQMRHQISIAVRFAVLQSSIAQYDVDLQAAAGMLRTPSGHQDAPALWGGCRRGAPCTSTTPLGMPLGW